jgi:hypothetical protein
MNESIRQTVLAVIYGALLAILFFLSAGSAAVYVYQGF